MRQKPQVLLVDDNPADVNLVCEASAAINFQSQIASVDDGEKAIAYLHHRAPYTQASRPDLIILDLNLPRKDGRKVLTELKGDPELSPIPVVIFSSSRAPQGVAECYGLGANCYVCKPVSLDGFFSAIGSIEKFWFETASLPEENAR